MTCTIARRMSGYATSEDGSILPTASWWELFPRHDGTHKYVAVTVRGIYAADATGHITDADAIQSRHVGLTQIEELERLGLEVIE